MRPTYPHCLAWAVALAGALLALAAIAAPVSAQPPARAVADPSGDSPAGALARPPQGTADFKPGQPEANTLHSYYSINITWVLLCGFLVMFMQAGFALLETGLCRAKNAAHTMSMNLLVYAIGMLAFWIIGFALMSGGVSAPRPGAAAGSAPFIGGPAGLGGLPTLDRMAHVTLFGKPFGLFGKTGFFLAGGSYDAAVAVYFLFMMVFMDTALTIPTGALAERWRFKSFFIFSLVAGMVIYPIYGCWMWGGGWLAALGQNFHLGHGAVDYAGSSVVHMQGGVMALVTAWLLGPRMGKYDHNGNPRPILGHHVPMVMLGTLILAFGWFGFNAGSAMAGSSHRIGQIAVNTMLASAAGAVTSTLYLWVRYGKPDPSMMCNGMLAGLVAITAPCAFVPPWAAVMIGIVAGILGDLSVFFWERRGIDDPVGAISVHGVNGLWGILAVGLFADGTYGDGWNGVAGTVRGLFFGDGRQFVAQLVAAVTCFAWNFIVAGVAFTIIGKLIGSNRVPPEVEVAGLDIPEMGAPGYPEFITSIAPEAVSYSQLTMH